MVIDALRGYLQLASGLTEVSRERARAAARAVVAQAGNLGDGPGDTPAQIRRLADELGRSARDNRDLLLGMVRVEAERAAAAVGVAGADDVAALKLQVERLSRRVDELARMGAGAGAPRSSPPAGTSATKGNASTRTPTRKTAPSRASASRSGASASAADKNAASKTSAAGASAGKARSRTAANTAPATKTAARRTSTGNAPASKATARKTAARKTAAGKTSTGNAPASKATARKTAASKAAPSRAAGGGASATSRTTRTS